MPSLDRDVLYDTMTEAMWQRQVIQWARRGGWLVMHMHSSREQEWGTDAGFPDLVLARAGSSLLLPELKRERGRITPSQVTWANAINASEKPVAPLWRPSNGDAVRSLLCGQ